MPHDNPRSIPAPTTPNAPQPYDDLLPAVYDELRRLARARLSKLAPGQTLQATALVNEAVLRLLGGRQHAWEDTRHFFFAAAKAMHDILVDDARKKASAKHGGGHRRLGIDQLDVNRLTLPAGAPTVDMLALDDALQRLQRDEPRWHQIVLLRFFAGLSSHQASEMMGIPLRSLERQWRFIRARLHRELSTS